MIDEQNELGGPPSKAEQAAWEISHRSRSFVKGELVPVSVRIPSWNMGTLDAMVARSGSSRNHVINLVLDAGLAAVLEHMEPEARREIEWLASDAMSTTRDEGQNTSGVV